MQVKNIANTDIKKLDASSLNQIDPKTKPGKKSEPKLMNKTDISSWQKSILSNALDQLENIKQVDNSHPLGKLENAPIQTLSEALDQLKQLKSSDFKTQAYKAQANLAPQDISYLFMES